MKKSDIYRVFRVTLQDHGSPPNYLVEATRCQGGCREFGDRLSLTLDAPLALGALIELRTSEVVVEP